MSTTYQSIQQCEAIQYKKLETVNDLLNKLPLDVKLDIPKLNCFFAKQESVLIQICQNKIAASITPKNLYYMSIYKQYDQSLPFTSKILFDQISGRQLKSTELCSEMIQQIQESDLTQEPQMESFKEAIIKNGKFIFDSKEYNIKGTEKYEKYLSNIEIFWETKNFITGVGEFNKQFLIRISIPKHQQNPESKQQ